LLRSGIDVSRLRELPDGRYAYRLSRPDRKGVLVQRERDRLIVGETEERLCPPCHAET
jgi:hypothetical protein